MIARRRWLAALATGSAAPWLGACAALAPREAPELSGRLAIRIDAAAQTPSRSFSADFDLRGDARRGQLSLTGPLGAMLAELRWEPGLALLVRAQGEERFSSLDELARELLGESLPLAALTDWLRGRPWSGAPSQALADGFLQLGWRIGLARQADGLIEAERDSAPAVSVRARVITAAPSRS